MSDTIHIDDFDDPQFTPEMLELMAAFDADPPGLDNDTFIQLAGERLDVPMDVDDGLLARAQSVIGQVMAHGDVHGMGRMTLQQNAVDGLVNTSRMNYLHNTYAEVGQTPVAKPIVVVGMPRSGTTHLLKLLSVDDSLRTLKRWQCYDPLPSRGMLEGTAPDNREEEGGFKDQMSDVMVPHMRGLFDVSAGDATEEIEFMGKAYYGVAISFQGDTPQYDDDFYRHDQTEAYRYLYRFLQAMQWVQRDDGCERWLLKTPQHMGALKALKNVFPDAPMVFTHRDPASVFTSLVTLIGYVERVMYRKPTREQILEKTWRMQHGLLRGLVNDIDSMTGPVEHVYFDKFMQDKHGTIERVYKAAGMDFDSATEQRISEELNTHTRGRHGRFVYDLEGDWGLTRDQVRKEFAYYIDRFPVAIEESHQ
jgi:hypothetical protein